MIVDPRDYAGMMIYIYGAHQQYQFTAVYAALLRPGDCMVDVGANIGSLALQGAQLVGPGGTVYAFEASPGTSVTLKQNVALNPGLNVSVYNSAVSDTCGSVSFFTAVDNTALSSIRDVRQKAKTIQATVPTVTLDSVLQEFRAIKFVKIDVEGAEYLVLKGMAALIQRDQPYILLEIDDAYLREAGASAAMVYTYLTEANYSLYRVEYDGLRMVTETPTSHCDVLCAPANRTVPGQLHVLTKEWDAA